MKIGPQPYSTFWNIWEWVICSVFDAMNLAQSSSNLLLGVTIPQSLHFFYFLIQTFDPQQPPAIQSRAINDPQGDGDSLACFDRSDPLPVDDSSPFSAPSPFIPSMHFFIGRIWDGGSKECLCAWFFQQIPSLHCSWWCTTRVMLGMACWRKAAVPLPPPCVPVPPAHPPIRPQITHFFNESHNSWYWAIWDSLSSPSFHQN